MHSCRDIDRTNVQMTLPNVAVISLLALGLACSSNGSTTPDAGDSPGADAMDTPTPDSATPDSAAPDTGPDAPSCVGDASIASQCSMACAAGEVCWDFSKYDQFCSGTVCSIPCCSNSECVAYAARKGAAPNNTAGCGSDHICNFVGVLGSFVCQ